MSYVTNLLPYTSVKFLTPCFYVPLVCSYVHLSLRHVVHPTIGY